MKLACAKRVRSVASERRAMCLGLAPPQERRKEMTKVVSKLGEEGKVAIRWAERLTAAAADSCCCGA